MNDRLRPPSVTRRDVLATAGFGALMFNATTQAAESPSSSHKP